jgi:peptidylprolyl isomerase
VAGALLLGLAAVGPSACAQEADEPLFHGEAPPMPDDVGELAEDALARMEQLRSARVVNTLDFGGARARAEGEWSRDGVGQLVMAIDVPGEDRIELEVRSDGEAAWLRSDVPGYLDEMPPGRQWIELTLDDLRDASLMTGRDRAWDGLLFARVLDDVEDGGVDQVNGDLVRVVRGDVDYEAAYEGVPDDERDRMDGVVSFHGAVRDFDAELAFDAEGLLRRLDYDVDVGLSQSPTMAIEVRIEVLEVDDDVEPPDAPDPDEVVPLDEASAAFDVVLEEFGVIGAAESRGAEEPFDEAPPDDPAAEEPDIEDPAGVLDRGAPDPEPPPADTPPDAVESTTVIDGEGPGAGEGDMLFVHYVVVRPDGEQVDSSWERGTPFPFTIGAGLVIAGWEEGMVGARVGERRRLVIGADQAYGDQGQSSGGIPPDTPLAFEIDVVWIEPGG